MTIKLLVSPHRSLQWRLGRPNSRLRSILQAFWQSCPACNNPHCKSSWTGQSRRHTLSCRRVACRTKLKMVPRCFRNESFERNDFNIRPQLNYSTRSAAARNSNSHAVASCQVSVQEVAPAEVLHAQGNVNHEFQECLGGQKLQTHTYKQVGWHDLNFKRGGWISHQRILPQTWTEQETVQVTVLHERQNDHGPGDPSWVHLQADAWWRAQGGVQGWVSTWRALDGLIMVMN